MDKNSVNATPVKSFFVEMLTRDISLDDAILDLMDNSVDGVMRTIGKKSLLGELLPYSGYWVKITITEEKFVIEDNCGGIPWKILINYAFRMGRSPDFKEKEVPTVGTFGIGMKRAIFKMGRKCSVLTFTGIKDARNTSAWHEVQINPAWIDDAKTWDIPLRTVSKGLSAAGTRICIENLTESTSREFSGATPEIRDRLIRSISETYALIIAKGFRVYVNNELIKPRPMALMINDMVQPYGYLKEFGKVRVQLIVGLTGPLQTEEEQAISDMARDSAANAGWTVVCNDRVVLYCDKTTQTGWGELPVPKFHNQFIKISGIVYFESEDARLLPTTTTKRGVDANNRLYQEIKNKMREGTKKFTDFTNKWKANLPLIKRKLESVPLVPVTKIRNILIDQATKGTPSQRAKIASVGVTSAAKYPVPERTTSRINNRFWVTIDPDHIPDVADFLGLKNCSPEKTIECAFDHVYRKGVQK